MIRQAIESVADNSEANVEHIVVDGGSTDGTIDVLAEFPHLKVIQGQDKGPYDAINIGLSRATGDVFAWLNADDFYVPKALDVVSSIFATFKEIDWLTTAYPLYANAAGQIVGSGRVECYSERRALRPNSAVLTGPVPTLVQQESTFWRRTLWEHAGATLNTQFKLAADFELWLRFWETRELCAIEAPLGCFRYHDAQRSYLRKDEYQADVEAALRAHGGRRIGILRTALRLAALNCRGLPQAMLRYCPFASTQQFAAFDRTSGAWRLHRRFAIPV